MPENRNWDMEAAKEFFPLQQAEAHSALHKSRFGSRNSPGESPDKKTDENRKKQ